MASYKKMYHRLFNAVTDVTALLEEASEVSQHTQAECEEMRLEEGEPAVRLEFPNRE